MNQGVFTDIQPALFWLIAGLTGISAILTVVTQNIVRAATWLLFTLSGAAAIFFLLGADFVGATQVLVYVGGTLVLVVFGVMLTAQGPFITMKTGPGEWAMSVFVGIALYAVLAICVLNRTEYEAGPVGQPKKKMTYVSVQPAPPPIVAEYAPKQRLAVQPHADEEIPASEQPARSPYTDTLGQGFLGKGVGPAHMYDGKVVRTAYLLPFEIVSVHLLVVLIGAAYLARAKRRRGAAS